MKKRVFALLLASAMLLPMIGCSSSSDSSTTTTESTTTTAVAEEDRPYYVRSADEVTGTLTVYTTMSESQQTDLRDLWSTYYPDCKLEIMADSVGTLATRIRSDESSDADVVIGGLFAADGTTYHDILQPYTPACDDEQLYHDESGYYTFYDVQVMGLVVNPELRDKLGIEINGYEDLLNPALEGKIILAAPDASSSAWRQLQTMLAVMGDEFDDETGWAYIEQLIPSSFSTTSSKDVYNLVISGEYVVGLSYESGIVEQIEDGAQVECIYMEEGNTAMAGGAAIVDGAPNLSAAEAMMDLLSSAEFQNIRAVTSSGRGSNANCDLNSLPAEDTMTMVELDFDYLAENKEQMIEHWNDLVAELG